VESGQPTISQNSSIFRLNPREQGRPLLSAPRTDPCERDSRTGLPPRMSDGEALVRPRMCDFRLWKELVRDLPDPFPCHGVFLAAPSERAQKEPDYVASEHIQRLCIRRHCMVVEVSPDNLSQPFADYGNRQVHVASQDFLDLPELRAHAVLAGLSLDGERPHSAFSADEREAQKVESLRFPQPLLLSAGRRRAAKLDQSGLV